MKILFFGWICREIVWMEFDENLCIQALLPSWQSQLVIFTKSLFAIGQYPQFCRLVPHFHDFLSSAHMTLTWQSVRFVGFGMLIEQILCGANFMLIGPQENVSFICMQLTEMSYSVNWLPQLPFSSKNDKIQRWPMLFVIRKWRLHLKWC